MSEEKSMVQASGVSMMKMEFQEMENLCTWIPETMEEKIQFYNVLTNPEEQMGKHVNEILTIDKLAVKDVDVTDKNTGEVKRMKFIIVIDNQGKSYYTLSTGLLRSFSNLMGIFGPPPWPFGVKIKEVGSGQKRTFILDIVG